MKKTSLAVALAALTIASGASANWYAQGDLNGSRVKFSGYSSLDESKFSPRFSLGYDMGDIRLAADYTHHGKYSADERGEYLSSKIYGIGFSAIYDFSAGSKLQPYAGVRLAQNVFKIERKTVGYFSDDTENKFGYGVLGGVQYEFAPKVFLNGGIEYNRLGTYNDTKVNQYGANVGIRFNF